MIKYLTKLNTIFLLQIAVILFVILGFIPRESVLFSASILIFFVLFETVEDSIFLILRSIPLFVALPITSNFDSLNVWRLLILILFLKWFFTSAYASFLDAFKKILSGSKKSLTNSINYAYKNWKIEFLSFLFFIISIISIFKAQDLIIAIKRIIYFTNLGMLFFIIRSIAKKSNFEKISFNILISGIIIILIGFIQLGMAYVMTINDFSEYWALNVEKNLYGINWSNIVIKANTWFAYYNNTIHLRMFSSFPDTHSFPLYLLMVINFVITLIFWKKLNGKKNFLYYLFILFAIFALVLTGTRGIWVSVIFPIIILIFLFIKKYFSRDILKISAISIILFLILIPMSSFIFESKQFKSPQNAIEEKILSKRIKSIIDAGETSNKGRIYIWKETLNSIYKNPLLGVGMGNFPVVLKQDVNLIKEGSSAHNLYLHILAELGIFGFIIFIMIICYIVNKSVILAKNNDLLIAFFGLNCLLYLAWILGYNLTDVAIFDERAFLMLMIFTGVISGLSCDSIAENKIQK